MLMYLNGYENRNNAPNENYARELYELFTLGEGNGYTQDDITETARALTGYNNRQDGGPIYFNPNRFDNGEKTIFGRKGNWNYDDVINILFEEKSDLISKFIVRKLYKHFVSPDVNEAIVDELALYFINNNFELEPLYRKLFKSEHFINSFSSWLIQQIFPWEISNLGSALTFLIYGLIATVGVLLFIKILPETKGKSLEQLENELVKYNA